VRASGYRGRGTRAFATGAVAVAIHLAACSFEPIGDAFTDGQDDVDAGQNVTDGAPPLADAAIPPDGSVPDGAPPEPAGHLLLTEVKTQPSAEEFIEIYNPLDVEVSLADYYLTDDPQYALLPGADAEVPVGNGDAIVRFPAGAVLAAGQVIVVAVDEEGYRNRFASDPDYTLVPGSPAVAGEMESVADGSRLMDITDSGEPIVLFRWDEASDLVTDVDIVFVGNEAPLGADNQLPDKSAVEVDGPDGDATATPYADDAAAMGPMSFRAGNGGSYSRIALEGQDEARGGGNGEDGHDETSEDTLATWRQSDAPPTPGDVAGALRP
jgi:uncharacterized protein